MTALQDRAEAVEVQVKELQAQIQHALDCLSTSAVNAILDARRYAAKYGEFDRTVDHCEGLISGYIGGLFFLTHESQKDIRARVEKAADEKQAARHTASDLVNGTRTDTAWQRTRNGVKRP